MAALLKDIVFNGSNSDLIWKSPIEDFSLGSSLTVGESQEALFFKDGQALDLFSAGHYILETKNVPLLGKALNSLYGGDTPFHCSIYYINKVDHLAIKWGTDSKVEYLDPVYQFPLKIGMSGEMILSVKDARKLIIKLVGAESSYTTDTSVENFKGLLLSKLKPFIAKYMVANSVNIFEVDSHLEEFSKALELYMIPEYDEYGMELKRLYVNNIVKPEGEREYEKFKTLHFRRYTDVESAKLQQQLDIINAQTEAMKMNIESEAITQKRQREGYTYHQERSFDVAQDAANNEASGQLTNLGIGIGAMAGVGGAIGSQLGNTVSSAFNGMNTQTNATSEDPVAVLSKLKQLLDSNLITEEEYNQKKQEILGRM